MEHVFQHCSFSRAIWFGSDLTLRTNPKLTPSRKSWVADLIMNYRTSKSSQQRIAVILTTLRCIWFHRNQCISVGKIPNPIDTLLTFKTLVNRFMQVQTEEPCQQVLVNPIQNNLWLPIRDWQVITTTEAWTVKTRSWSGLGYIIKNREGQLLFKSCHTSRHKDRIYGENLSNA